MVMCAKWTDNHLMSVGIKGPFPHDSQSIIIISSLIQHYITWKIHTVDLNIPVKQISVYNRFLFLLFDISVICKYNIFESSLNSKKCHQ